MPGEGKETACRLCQNVERVHIENTPKYFKVDPAEFPIAFGTLTSPLTPASPDLRQEIYWGSRRNGTAPFPEMGVFAHLSPFDNNELCV